MMVSLGCGRRRRRVAFVVFVVFLCVAGSAEANVVLIGRNISLSFDDVEANFAPPIKGTGENGILYVAEPLDACTPLKNANIEGSESPFVLIIRGGCTFDEKVRNAQIFGFKAAIVYDYEDSRSLVAMAGDPTGIRIHAIFVSKYSGESLSQYAGLSDMETWIIPVIENSAWSIMAISFISLLAMSVVLATCFFVRRHRIRRESPRSSGVREFHGMSSRLVKAMPSLIFTSVLEDNCTSVTCAICLEDYSIGEKLRILPCHHKFHASCVDSWLTIWRSFCPVCKRDATASTNDPPASESTPLLGSSMSLLSSSAALSSFRSSASLSTSPAIQIRPPHHSPSTGSFFNNSHRSFNNSPSPSLSLSRRSAVDLRNGSSLRSATSYLTSPHSVGLAFSPPINSRHVSTFVPCSSNASPSYYHMGSSSRVSFLRHCNESDTSLSALASAQSLPGC